ncbi:MAG TPA: carboxypeptidase-like regulatory domain-containing protein, partial [Planctomycetota bacterium]|nr:carboxypeptidase-like regulatory domain-containing protein [Planctomycetota bacterium]
EGAKLIVSQDPLMFGQGGFDVRKGESGPDGAFELAAVAPGRSDLKVEADGFLETSRALELTDGRRAGDLVIQLDGGNSISGVVLWEPGRPAAGARVKVEFDMSQMAGMGAFNAMSGADGKGKSDAEGRFSVTGLGKGPFTVQASALPEGEPDRDAPDTRDNEMLNNEGRVTGTYAKFWRTRADGVKPGTSGLELVLEPPLGIDGVVVDDLGAPLAEFEVLARMSGQGLFGGLGAETRSEEFEDEAGRFRLEGLRRGTWELQARAERHALPDPVKLDVPRADGAQPVRLVVQRAAIASGVVLDPSGIPVAGAEVAVQLTMQEMMRDREQREPAKSGPDGRFELEGVPPGTVSLVAKSDGYAPSALVPIQAEPGAPVEEIVLRLRVGGRILGEIFNKAGLPAAGERILAQTPAGMDQMWASSDGSGQFVLEHVAPGTWQVMAMPSLSGGDGGEGQDFAALFADMRLTMAEVKDGEDVHVSLGRPPKAPVKVRGRITLGGEGAGATAVSFIADGGKGMESMRFTSSDAQGRYEVQLDAPGSYLTTVQKMGSTGGQQQSFDLHVQIPEQPEHRLDIELPVGGISGRVRGADGQPTAGARISLMVDGPIANGSLTGGHYAELETDADGRYELDWLDEGTYEVSAGGAPFGGLFGSDAQFGRQVKSGLKLSKGQWLRDVDFKLGHPGAIAGSVHDGAGQAVADAAIFVRDEGGRTVDRFSMVTTDPAGNFTYGGLQPGRYSVSARSSTLVSSGTAQVQVRGGETSQVKLVLEGGTILIVSLSDGEGNPVNCEISVLDADGRQVNGLWSYSDIMSIFQEGGFSTREQRVGPLPPGKYRVIVVSKAGETVEKPVTLSGQPERKLNLRLKE